MFGFLYSIYVAISKMGSSLLSGARRIDGINNNADRNIGIYTDSKGVQRWIRGNDIVGISTDLNGDVWYTNARTCKNIYNISAAKRGDVESEFRTVSKVPGFEYSTRKNLPNGTMYKDKKYGGIFVKRKFFYGEYFYNYCKLNHPDYVDKISGYEVYMSFRGGIVYRPTDRFMFINKLCKDYGKVYRTQEEIDEAIEIINKCIDGYREYLKTDPSVHIINGLGERVPSEDYWKRYWIDECGHMRDDYNNELIVKEEMILGMKNRPKEVKHG